MSKTITPYVIAIALILALSSKAYAERTVLTEPCNRTDTDIVWFEAIGETVVLTTTAQDMADHNLVTRTLTFQDGRSVDLPTASHFLYDAVVNCDTYVAAAKSSVLGSLSSGTRYIQLHEDYQAMLEGKQPCQSAEQSRACTNLELDTLDIRSFADGEMTSQVGANPTILTLREHAFGLSTYALDPKTLNLLSLFYEGT